MKATKKHAGYVQGQDCYCCGTCKFFISPNACQIVSGTIQYHGCCNLWKLRKKGLSCARNKPPSIGLFGFKF